MRRGHEGHYMIVPKTNMPLKKYLGILEELGLDRSKVILLIRYGVIKCWIKVLNPL